MTTRGIGRPRCCCQAHRTTAMRAPPVQPMVPALRAALLLALLVVQPPAAAPWVGAPWEAERALLPLAVALGLGRRGRK